MMADDKPPTTSNMSDPKSDFFHSNNSKMLTNALSNLTAAIVPASTSNSSICSVKLLNEALEVSRRNSNFFDSIKKSFLSSASEKKKIELQQLMDDVLIEQEKGQLSDSNQSECLPSTSIKANNLVKTSPIRLACHQTSASNVDLIEQTKNQTLKALISGPYSTKKIPLPPPSAPIDEDPNSKRPRPNNKQLVSVGEQRLSELKNEIIDLVRTNTASSFPVEENTSSAAVNKKLVQELNEKEANLTKNMNKHMSYLESTLAKNQAKKELISNFLKLKNLLNANNTAEEKSNGSTGPSVKKLTMRSGSGSNGHKLLLDDEQIMRINARNFNSNIKRLNLYSSIKSSLTPNGQNFAGKLDDELIDDDEETGEDDDDDNDDSDENENEEEDDEAFENITIRKRLTEPHVYVRGQGRGKYECSKCGWRARKLSTLKRHVMVRHAEFKPFLCTYCKCAFKTKGNLVRHTKTKSHLTACSKLGMSPNDEEVTRITSDNIDNKQLTKQLEFKDKKIKVS